MTDSLKQALIAAYSDMCRVHPGKVADWLDGELCQACVDRLKAATRRINAGDPITPAQMRTVRGIGRPNEYHLERFDLVRMKRAGVGHSKVSRDKRRGKKAYAMRALARDAAGARLTWVTIADKLGFSGSPAAIKSAKLYAKRRDMPWPPPALGEE
tara:strand:+ start:1961 stop:2428 length:468 start_codon:yes stop_codon:yes gene_type:complete